MKIVPIVVCLTLGAPSLCRAQGSIQRTGEPGISPTALESLLEPPEEVLKAYLDGLKAGPIYAFARDLASDKVEPEVAAWSKDLGVPIQVRSVGFLKFILEDLKPEIKSGDDRIWAAMVPVEIGVGRRFDLPGLIVQGVRGAKQVAYRLPAGKLEDLDFRFVRSLTIVNPLNKVLDRYTVERRPLSEVVVELCRTAGVDFANRDEAAGEVVSVQLNKKKLIDCLRLAASVGGKRVKVEPQEPYDAVTSFESAFPAWTMRRFLNESEKPQPPLETALDVLRYLVAKRAAGLKDDPQVVLLLPKEAEKR
jgi:hypothetical protein